LLLSAQLPEQFAQALCVVRDDPTPLRSLVGGLFAFVGVSLIVGWIAHVSSIDIAGIN